jgi:cytochrome c
MAVHNTGRSSAWTKRLAALVALGFGALAPSVHAAGDPGRGAKLFGQCAACHSTAVGEHLTGPSLAHVWDRKAAGAEGFQRYSEALKKSGLTWNEATLDRWLANPEALVPGTSMTFPGLREASARRDVIAYLRAVSEGSAAAPAPGRMGARRADLKQAPPQAQVTAVTHCGDTYTIRTADRQSQKVWEFNLRLKTDSSAFGPDRGKPVVVGSGMQGDRASLVFASPAEISGFIKNSCP